MKRLIALVAALALLLAGCAGADHDDADVQFAQQMIPHHAQAVEMADMALDQADDPAVRDLAERIAGAQEPEIRTMSDWLEAWDEEVPSTDGSMSGGMGEMEGMMTSEDMDRLAQASGPAFDRLWLELMIEHHTGAIAMAEAEQRDGEYDEAVELAGEIASTQQAEITEMERLLQR